MSGDSDIASAFTKSAIRRIAHKAGIKYFSESIYEDIQKTLKTFLENVLKIAITYTSHARRVTVSKEDVLTGLQSVYRKVYTTGDEDNVSRCATSHGKAKKGNIGIRLIKYYQKQSDCVHFSKAGIDRVVREIASKQVSRSSSLHFAADAIGTLHIVLEDYLVELLENLHMVAVHAGRQKVMVDDLKLIHRLKMV